jgi:hypothetical protein
MFGYQGILNARNYDAPGNGIRRILSPCEIASDEFLKETVELPWISSSLDKMRLDYYRLNQKLGP